MHCNLRPPEPRQPFPALTTTPCQVWSHLTYPLPYYSVFAADTLLYAETLNFEPATLTFHIWPWTFTTNPCLNYSIFDVDTLCHAVTLTFDPTFDPFSLKVRWFIKRHVIKFGTKFEPNRESPAELLIIWRIFAHVMSCCDLDLWPLDLELLYHFGYRAFKLATQFERNQIIHRWVIDGLACFRCAILGVGTTDKRFSGNQLHQTWWGHRAIIPT